MPTLTEKVRNLSQEFANLRNEIGATEGQLARLDNGIARGGAGGGGTVIGPGGSARTAGATIGGSGRSFAAGTSIGPGGSSRVAGTTIGPSRSFRQGGTIGASGRRISPDAALIVSTLEKIQKAIASGDGGLGLRSGSGL